MAKTVHLDAGVTTAWFSFSATNPSDTPVVVTSVSTSCRCTMANWPSLPYTIAPRSTAVMQVSVWLGVDQDRGRHTVFLETSAGACEVQVTAERTKSAAAPNRGG
jgi:hypothetical protein